jgi:hypothetical protein
MSSRLALCLALPLLTFSSAFAAPTAASADPLPAPTIPRNTVAYWSSAKTDLKAGELTVIDTIGGNNYTAAGWLTVKPGAGLFFDGTQTAPAKPLNKQIVTPDFTISVSLQPSGAGAEFQTPVYIYGFCEFRYRVSRSELSFNVWRKDAAGDMKTAGSVKLPIVAGKWNRVQAVIQGDIARLTVNGVTGQTALDGSWDNFTPNKPLMIGFGGTDRAYQGGLDHLLFAPAP